MVDHLADWYADRNPAGPPTAAVFQEHCLDYTRYVLDQHRAGMTTDQITATLDQAASIADQYPTSGKVLHEDTACEPPNDPAHSRPRVTDPINPRGPHRYTGGALSLRRTTQLHRQTEISQSFRDLILMDTQLGLQLRHRYGRRPRSAP